MRWNPDRNLPPRKTLLIQLRRIGDAVLITPALDALREVWPETRVHLLTSDPVADLFVGDPRVNVVWRRPGRFGVPGLARRLRKERFDLALDFQSLPLTALLGRLTRAHAVGFRRRGRTLLYHQSVNVEEHRDSGYSADHKLDLLRVLGLSPRLRMPRLVSPPPDPVLWQGLGEGPRVALFPVSPWAHKRWAASSFAEAARHLHRTTGCALVLAGGPGEESQVQAVARDLKDVPHRTVCFRRLRELMAFLAGTRLFLGNDNGPRHIAIALGVPTVGFFGPHNPMHWTPPATDLHAVFWDPEYSRGKRTREDVVLLPPHPRDVAEGAARILAGPEAGIRCE